MSRTLNDTGIATPRTVITSSFDEAKKALSVYKKAVSKPIFDCSDREIIILEDGFEADLEKLKRILKDDAMVYLQEFIASERYRNIRAFVVNGKVLGAIYQDVPLGQSIVDPNKSGLATICPLNRELVEIATNAAKAMGTVYCNIDLLETAHGLSVTEMNGIPNGKEFFEVLGVNVTEAIAKHVHQYCYLRRVAV